MPKHIHISIELTLQSLHRQDADMIEQVCRWKSVNACAGYYIADFRQVQ